MNCKTIHKSFSERLDDRLPSERRRLFDDHVAACADCGRRWREYETFFLAVRSLPGPHTDRPAPLPQSTRAFGAANRRVSPVFWMSTAASVIILLGFVARVAYDLGRNLDEPRTGPPVSDGNREVSSNLAGLPVKLPSKQAGGLFSRYHNTLSHLGAIVDMGAAAGNPDVIDLVDETFDELPVAEDAARLVKLDRFSLGDFEDKVHRLATDGGQWIDEVSKLMRTKDLDRRACLEEARRRIVDLRLADNLRDLQLVAKSFEPEPFELRRRRGGADDVAVQILRWHVLQDQRRAFEIFSQSRPMLEPRGLARILGAFSSNIRVISGSNGESSVLIEVGGNADADMNALLEPWLPGTSGPIMPLRIRTVVPGKIQEPPKAPKPSAPVIPGVRIVHG